jgi:hypothetical protein
LIEIIEERAGLILICLVCAFQWGASGVRTRSGARESGGYPDAGPGPDRSS